jgi:hypothetical protein
MCTEMLLTEICEKVHSGYSSIYPTRCNVTQFILSGNCSTCFGWYHHPTSGAQTIVSTASAICHTVIAISRYRGRVGTGLSVLWVVYATASGICHTVISICRHHGRVGTGLSVLWVVYATHSTLKPVPSLPR